MTQTKKYGILWISKACYLTGRQIFILAYLRDGTFLYTKDEPKFFTSSDQANKLYNLIKENIKVVNNSYASYKKIPLPKDISDLEVVEHV